MSDMHTAESATDRINAATVAVLRSVMAVRKVSQGQVADKIGMARGSVSRYLNGHRDVPLALVFGVAAAAGIAASELIERIGREMAEPLL